MQATKTTRRKAQLPDAQPIKKLTAAEYYATIRATVLAVGATAKPKPALGDEPRTVASLLRDLHAGYFETDEASSKKATEFSSNRPPFARQSIATLISCEGEGLSIKEVLHCLDRGKLILLFKTQDNIVIAMADEELLLTISRLWYTQTLCGPDGVTIRTVIEYGERFQGQPSLPAPGWGVNGAPPRYQPSYATSTVALF